MKKFIVILNLVCASFTLFASNNFYRIYGGALEDDSKHIIRSADGNCVTVGSTSSYGTGSMDSYLFKTDSLGQIIWSKIYGDLNDDYFEWVDETHDKGLILCGYTFSVTKQRFELVVVKTDSIGDIQWQKKIALAEVTRAYCIRETFDHGFILCGEEDSSGIDGNILIVKLDSVGDILWNKSYGSPINADVASCIIQTRDSGFALCGYSRFGLNSSYAVILKTNSSGDLIWSKYYYDTNQSDSRVYPKQITELVNGKFILSGSAYHVGQPQINMHLFSLDSLGNQLWSYLYSTGNWDAAEGMLLLPGQEGFFMYGYTSSAFSGNTIPIIVKTDFSGSLIWNEYYGNDSIDGRFESAVFRDENNIVLTGNNYFFGTGDENILQISRDTLFGSTICYTDSGSLTQISFSMIDNGPATLYPLSLATTNLNFITGSGAHVSDLCLGTDISEELSVQRLSLYPNPGNQIVSILNQDNLNVKSITLLDILGNVILKKEINIRDSDIRISLPLLRNTIV